MKTKKSFLLTVLLSGFFAAQMVNGAVGGEGDPVAVFQKSEIAATAGDREAQYRLGGYYDSGEGVEHSDGMALKWYAAAAAQGHLLAKNRIGVHYMNGWGVRQNPTEARKWFRAAAKGGHIFAVTNLRVIELRLSRLEHPTRTSKELHPVDVVSR